MLERVTNQVNCKFSNKILTVLGCLLCNKKLSQVTDDPQMSDPDTFISYIPAFLLIFPTHASLLHPRISVEAIISVGRY